MIGKRVILKRPTVFFAVVFVMGVVMERYPVWVTGGTAVGLALGCICFLRHLRKGRRRISTADRLLVLAPVFLLFGYGVMSRAQVLYENDATAFAGCMKTGREVLAEGKVSHIRWTENGVRIELKDAVAASYNEEETVYRPVGKLLVYTDDIYAENGEIKYGQQIFVYGNGSTFEEASNPGGFDAKAYYFSLGITGAVHGRTLRIRSFSHHRLNQALFQAKNKLLESYMTYLGTEGAGVISSMLLGERALLSEETQELYRHGGISHILAISGLHVSLIGKALYELLRRTILGRNGAIPVACGGVLLYGSFVEAGTSTKRAVIMFLLLLLATALGRTYDTLSAMSVSVIVILCQSPGALYTASFQLSFAAAYGASVLAAVLQKWGDSSNVSEKNGTGEAVEIARRVALRNNSKWFRGREYISEKVRNMFVFGLAIQAVTFPFVVYHFFEYPTYGLLLNPIVVPLMTILLLCGLLSGVCGLFVPWLGYFFAGGTGGILWIYDCLCRLSEKLPGSLLLIGRPEVWQIGIYFVFVAVCLYVWVKQRTVLLCLLFLPFVLLPVSFPPFQAVFLDVGQGDGIVLRERGGAVLMVDGGSTSVQAVGEKRIIPYLKSQGIRVVDCAFVSHTDSDHISGLQEILTAMPVCSEYRESVPGYTGTPIIKSLVLPEWYALEEKSRENGEAEPDAGAFSGAVDEAYSELLRLAKEKKVEVYYMKAGDLMKVGKELKLRCLAPEEGAAYDNKNAASMVLLASYGAFDLLLTGDMEKEGELRLLEDGVFFEDVRGGEAGNGSAGELSGIAVEVLKVSHHGSYTASSEEFIAALQPRISVISCGKNNRYGHPHTETLETLYGANSRVYRTDESGCVKVKVGKRIIVDVFNK